VRVDRPNRIEIDWEGGGTEGTGRGEREGHSQSIVKLKFSTIDMRKGCK
jgi:hypothetical protein